MLRCVLSRRLRQFNRMLLLEQASGTSVPAGLSARAAAWRSAATGAVPTCAALCVHHSPACRLSVHLLAHLAPTSAVTHFS